MNEVGGVLTGCIPEYDLAVEAAEQNYNIGAGAAAGVLETCLSVCLFTPTCGAVGAAACGTAYATAMAAVYAIYENAMWIATENYDMCFATAYAPLQAAEDAYYALEGALADAEAARDADLAAAGTALADALEACAGNGGDGGGGEDGGGDGGGQ